MRCRLLRVFGGAEAFREEGSLRTSFLKKRSKKLLRPGTEILEVPGLSDQKFFGSFFSKKELLSLEPLDTASGIVDDVGDGKLGGFLRLS